MRFSRMAYIGLAALLAAGCKTTEANYRAAYEKAIEARSQEDSIDSTIYGDVRRQMGTKTIELPDGKSVDVRTQRVRVTDGGGGIRENLHRYNVVVGQFKQVFNAKSLRERLVDAGYPSAFVVETSEPYYYVVLASFDSAASASDAMNAFREKDVIAMRDPLPFILDATSRK